MSALAAAVRLKGTAARGKELKTMTIGNPADTQTSRIPFSANQEFTFMFDEGDSDGQFGPRNHLVHGWRVHGRIDVEVLRAALDDLVERHEMLRTSIVLGDDERYQKVLPPGPVELTVRDLPAGPAAREERAEELLIGIESRTLDIEVLPHLRAVFARFTADDGVLVLQVHHSIADGWSMRLLMRDLMTLYTARKAGLPIPDRPRQYREYVLAQREALDHADSGEARKYWRDRLRDAEVFALRTDRPESTTAPKLTSIHRHLITAEVVAAIRDLARKTRTTPFMVCLSALEIAFSRMSGRTDVVVPTFTPGRDDGRFDETVGTFFNFLPLRTDIAGCRTFREVLARTRRTCVESYAYDIPFVQIFEEAPDLMNPAGDENSALCVFQFFPFPYALDGERIGDVRLSEIRRRLVSQPVGCDVPDGILWTLNLHPDGDIIGHLQFRRNRFDDATATRLEQEFTRILTDGVTAPDAPLTPAG
jgi:hypothetical protein